MLEAIILTFYNLVVPETYVYLYLVLGVRVWDDDDFQEVRLLNLVLYPADYNLIKL